MPTGVEQVADEAVRRARAATGFLVVFLAVIAAAYTVEGDSDASIVAQGVSGMACFLASLRAVRHGYRHGHREGRTAGYLGLAVTTAGIGWAAAVALRPDRPVSGITRSTR
jgi:phage tail tape-measure protein